MINKFLSGLNPLQKKLLAIAAVVVLVVLFERLLLSPSLSRIKLIDGKIAKEEVAIEEDLKFLSNKDAVVKEAGVFKDFYTTEIRSEEEVIAAFLKKVELLAAQASVQTSKMTPAGQDYQKDFLKYFVTLDCAGTLENITNLVYAINSSKELLKVEKMTLGAARGGDSLQASLTVSKMIVGADPALEAKSFVRIKQDGSVKEEPQKAQ